MDNSFNPILTTLEERKKFIEKTIAPIVINTIECDVKNNMKSFVESFNNNIKDPIIKICQRFGDKELALSCDKDSNESDSNDNQIFGTQESDFVGKQIIRNVLTNSPFEEPDYYQLNQREEELKLFIEQRNAREISEKNYAQLRRQRSELPIASFREQIIKTIEENRVVVIAGDTGCGKTTQVPQYIFDNEIANERAAFANILVTQPRRISAISMSERVALEFGEEIVGNSIGYQVRFDKSLPNYENGAILFCTAGILLRKLQSNQSLKGVSHVIIDEVHERDVITDFLLVLLKRVLRLNPNIRIILMSASMNAHLFVEYFDSCPLIEIPGRCFPVKHYYLNEFIDKIGENYLSQKFSTKNPKINRDLIINLINYINNNKSDGAILCFLPGWADIQNIQNELNVQNEIQKNLLVIPIHSKLPHSMQKQIFAKTPVGVRKVVLATNIAETSLTIDDVVYVIDPGLANEMRYNALLNVSAFGTHWISKANAKQRSGRAGRVTSGECYRLYPKEVEMAYMDEFPTPELLRVPLENVIMQAKFHCPNEAVQQFLSEVPQPPTLKAIESAIKSLKEIKVIDNNERLTLLGKRIVSFTTHPRLSVALVYSSMFGCLSSMLSLVSQLSATREPFQVMPDQRAEIRVIKKGFSLDMFSDHISLVHLTKEYENRITNNRELSEFCTENLLSRYSMDNILEMKRLFASHLEESEFIVKNVWKYFKSDCNQNCHRRNLLIASLVPGLTPNFVRLLSGELKNTKINRHKMSQIDVNSGKKVKFVGESLFSGNPNGSEVEKMANSIIIYFGSFFSQDARKLTICDASVVSPICLLLFCDRNYELSFEKHLNLSQDECVVILRNNKHLQFKINKQDLELINTWNEILNLFSQWFVIPKNLNNSNLNEDHIIKNSLKEFIQISDELIKDYIQESQQFE